MVEDKLPKKVKTFTLIKEEEEEKKNSGSDSDDGD